MRVRSEKGPSGFDFSKSRETFGLRGQDGAKVRVWALGGLKGQLGFALGIILQCTILFKTLNA
jgi:hypothetical protein